MATTLVMRFGLKLGPLSKQLHRARLIHTRHCAHAHTHRQGTFGASHLPTRSFTQSSQLCSKSSETPGTIFLEPPKHVIHFQDWDALSTEGKIKWTLDHGERKWGWAIYRTCYKPELESVWRALKENLEYELRTTVAESDAPEIAEKRDWPMIEDPELDGASLEDVKSRFRDWARAQSTTDLDNCPIGRGTRFDVFVQVDEDSLRSFLGQSFIHKGRPTGVNMPRGHVNLVRGWVKPIAPDEAMDEFGCLVDNEDWMKINFGMLRADFYLEFGDEELWFNFYSPPTDGVMTDW